jgi:hypothetical protein
MIPSLRVALRWALIDVQRDLVFAEYGGLANDVLATYLLILFINPHSLFHQKIRHIT